MAKKFSIVPVEQIESVILLIRGKKVMLDVDLARLYGVKTHRLNEQVKRNRERFPEDFMFQLSAEEKAEVIASCDHLHLLKFSSKLPYAFTEHGAVMLASVLNSLLAVKMSIQVVRAFVRLRQMLAAHKELAGKLEDLEKKYEVHDKKFKVIVDAIRELMAPSEPKPKFQTRAAGLFKSCLHFWPGLFGLKSV